MKRFCVECITLEISAYPGSADVHFSWYTDRNRLQGSVQYVELRVEESICDYGFRASLKSEPVRGR
jgi:hypothetical protein